MDMEQKAKHHVEGMKKNWTLIFDPQIVAVATEQIREEFLDVIAEVLEQSLSIASGDVDLLYESERKLLDVYASWDLHNKGRRLTSTALIEKSKDDTWPVVPKENDARTG